MAFLPLVTSIEVMHPLDQQENHHILAGPASKRGRIAADNMLTRPFRTYKGTMGTASLKCSISPSG
ncbi:MAG: hypothetical protein R2864_00085 [Syntrophotaleaceae bacterium]